MSVVLLLCLMGKRFKICSVVLSLAENVLLVLEFQAGFDVKYWPVYNSVLEL